MAKKLTASKARKILDDKVVRGNPLTGKQKKLFGAIAGGQKPYEKAKKAANMASRRSSV